MGLHPADLEAWLAHLPHGVAALAPVRDGDGRIIDFRYDFVNTKLAQILDHPCAALLGRSLREVHRQPAVGAAIERLALAADRDEVTVDSLRSRSGSLVVSAARVGAHLVVATRHPAEEVRQNRVMSELLESLERSSDFLAVLDPVVDPASGTLSDFRIRSMNDAGLRRLGLSRGTAIGGLMGELLPGMAVPLRDGLRQVVFTGLPFVAEEIIGGQHYAGTMRVVATPFEDGIIVTSRDTSGETQTRAALAASEAQFRTTVEALYEGVIVAAPVRDGGGALVDLRVEFVNEVAAAVAGLSRRQIVGRTIGRLLGRVPHLLATCAEVLDSGRPAVVDVDWDDAQGRRTFEARIARSADGLVAAVQDVTERRRVAERIAESERRYRLLADHAGDVVLLSRGGRLEWVTASVEQLIGLTPEELAELPLMDWLHPEDAPTVVAAAISLARTGAGQGRMRAKHRDGSYVWIEVLLRAIPEYDPLGSVVVATVWNVQAQVEAEQELERAERGRRAQEERIQQATRLESLGVMAGGIAHDFNNLLVGVLGNTEMALHALTRAQGAASAEQVHAAIDRLGNVVIAAQRAAELTQQLLDYAGRRPRGREPVDLRDLLEELPGLVGLRLGANTELFVEPEAEAEAGRPVVLGDRGQLQQVLMNIVINAGDALLDRPGRVHVRLSTRTVAGEGGGEGGGEGDGDTIPGSASPAGAFAVVEVTDDGVGIDPDALGRIFEPFFTTRANGRGLGLAVVHGIVRSHGGRISVTSEPGIGTVMTVLLPTTDVVAAAPELTPPPPDVTTTPLVLLIDDDAGVAEVGALVLRSGGIEVDVETDPARAVERFRARPESYSAVLLDLSMPTMHGDQVLAGLRSIDPAVPVVVVSGDAEGAMGGRLDALGVRALVHKPYRAGDLLTAVVSALRPTTAVT